MPTLESKFSFKSKADGLNISVLRIEPENAQNIKGIVQLVHGMCEHKERYIDFMHFLAERGYLCVIHDHRGHGESINDFKDLGYMYDGGYKALIDDTHEVTTRTKEYVASLVGAKSDLPYTLLGHSMGSLVVRCYTKLYDNEIDKLAVLGCPSKLPGMAPGLMLINVFKTIFGGHARSKIVDYLVSGSNYESKFASEKLSHAWLNTDKGEVQKYLNDPYCMFTFTLNGYYNLVKLTMETYSPKNYKMENKNLPIHFFSGADDPCAISWNDLNKAMDMMKNAGYINVSGKMYDKMRHEILLEPNKMEVYEDIFAFIQE